MSEEWLTSEEAATLLSCTAETIRSMLRDRLLPGEKSQGQWRVKTSDVKQFQSIIEESTNPPRLPTSLSVDVGAGMVEVSIALAGIAAAIAAILTSTSGTPETLRLAVAILAGVVAVFSAYSALWLLSRFCLRGKSMTGCGEILALIVYPNKVNPYWFVALALLILLILSVLIVVLAIMR